MKQYIKLLSLAVLVAFSTSLVSQKKTFFDANWKKTKEKNAKYYRIVTPNGSEFQVEDYFKESDKLQMKGEPVTLENIEKEVRDTVGRATDAFNRPINDSNIVGKIGTVLLLIAKGFLKVVSARPRKLPKSPVAASA